MSVHIVPLHWGDANAADLQRLLESVIQVMDSYFASKINFDVKVGHDQLNGPIVLYDRGVNDEYQVFLSSKNRCWDQHSYQFSHEYCHIRTNYIEGNQKIKWFEETICELASLFTLRRMSEVWKISPPYINWRDYSNNLYAYAENRINEANHNYPEGVKFVNWFKSKLFCLEKDQYMRETNAIIAVKLLPMFEANPELWRAMTYFNSWEAREIGDIYQCFDIWLSCIPIELKTIVSTLAEVFGTKIQ